VVEEWVSLREFARRRGVSLQAVQKAIASGRVTAVRRAPAGAEGQPGRITAIEVCLATAQWNRNTDPAEAAKSGHVIPSIGFALTPPPLSPLQPLINSAQATLLIANVPETPGTPAGGSDDQAPGTRPADATPNRAPQTVIAAAVGLNGPAAEPALQVTNLAPAAELSLPLAAPAAELALPLAASANGAPAEPALAPDTPVNSEYYAHRAKREEFAAKTAELDYLEKIGVLVPAAGVRKAAYDAARALRDKLLGIPDRVAPLLAAERDPVRVHAALTTEITRTLHELSSRNVAPGGPGLSE